MKLLLIRRGMAHLVCAAVFAITALGSSLVYATLSYQYVGPSATSV